MCSGCRLGHVWNIGGGIFCSLLEDVTRLNNNVNTTAMCSPRLLALKPICRELSKTSSTSPRRFWYPANASTPFILTIYSLSVRRLPARYALVHYINNTFYMRFKTKCSSFRGCNFTRLLDCVITYRNNARGQLRVGKRARKSECSVVASHTPTHLHIRSCQHSAGFRMVGTSFI